MAPPLASGKSDLKSDLAAIFGDVNKKNSASDMGKRVAAAIDKFVVTGKPMTIITTMPGSVAGAMTGGPVMGKGIGGLDKPAPGMGLDAAKAILKSQLENIFGAVNANITADDKADQIANAIFSYFSQAIVMTDDMSMGPLPAPPPAGPVMMPKLKGKGGVGGSSSPGKGYSSAKSDLESALGNIFGEVDSKKSAGDQAKEISDAIHAFCKEGKVDTDGMFVAPAVVAVPPAPPMGAYMPGVGMGMGKIS